MYVGLMSTPSLNSYEKVLLYGLIVLHLVIGVTFLPAAVYYIHKTISTNTSFWPDFTGYYAAAHMIRLSPSLLYAQQAYMDFYQTLKPGVPAAFFGYLAPPPLAVLLYPLSLLSYPDSFLVFGMLNLAACLILAWQIGALTRYLQINELTLFLQSLVFGILITSNIIAKGQLTVFYAIFFTSFLLSVVQKNAGKTGFWLAVLLFCRPPLFLPLAFYLAGCRQWKAVAWTAEFCVVFILVTVPALGGIEPSVHIWMDYVRLLQQYGSGQLNLEVYYRAMLNLRGILSDLLGSSHSQLLSTIAMALYLLFTVFCFVWAWFARKPLNIAYLALITPFGFFFTTYLQVHDLLLLLPVAIIITALMRRNGQAKLMAIAYILASYEAGLAEIWCFRFCIVTLCVFCIYLAWSTKRWQGTQDQDSVGSPV